MEAIEENEVNSNLLDLTTNEETEITLSLCDVLQYVTGSYTVPATGVIERQSIEFDRLNTLKKLHVNLYANILTLSVTSNPMDSESFKQDLLHAGNVSRIWQSMAYHMH